MSRTIRVTNGQLAAILESPAAAGIVKKQLPIKTAYWLTRALEKMKREYAAYQTAKTGIIERLAEKDADGKPVAGPGGMVQFGDNLATANQEFTDLQGIEVDLGQAPIALDLEAGPALSVEELSLIMPLLEEPK